jgi:hypothetical protein
VLLLAEVERCVDVADGLGVVDAESVIVEVDVACRWDEFGCPEMWTVTATATAMEGGGENAVK